MARRLGTHEFLHHLCGVWHFLRREGLSFKKSLLAIEQGRADIARRRLRYGAMRRREQEPFTPSIEQAFSQIKHRMRIAQRQTIEETWKFLGKLIQTITPNSAKTTSKMQAMLQSMRETAAPLNTYPGAAGQSAP